MSFSLKKITQAYREVFDRITAKTTWKEDLGRGIETLLNGGALLADRSFVEIETIRLRREMDQVEEKLFQAYQSLGKRCMDHWQHDQELDEKGKNKAFQQITALFLEKEKLKDQLAAAKNPPAPDIPPSSESVPE